MTLNKENYFEDKIENNAVIIKPRQGEKLELNSISITFKITSEISNDQLGVYEILLPPMCIGAKLHYHRFMDETFIINEGVLTIQVGNKEYLVGPGAVVYVPRFTAHGFKNDSNEAVRLTLIFNPSQKREGFFRGLYETLNEVPVNPEKYLKLYNKYDSFPVDTSNMIPLRE
ncbi:cupin domain-containing protein [Flagellimonas sp. CMM7]|uniref:cupin domain-containing protein n=1 Tax=Flagellimonas sp. CMM7 TaxID=2654676 RepID=UPI0013D102E7|nr:cupin domain-containing protein [Flagellimonas sp. CMM7]UII81612.1 cupin domain-containing protein [Flagellimonas sp. CMM7]